MRYIGASSMFAWQFARALYRAELKGLTRVVSMQGHYNLLYREEEREMIPLCQAEGIAVLPWSPLARGYLTRRPGEKEATARGQVDDYARKLYNHPGSDAITNAVADTAEARGVRLAQIALAWVLHQPQVTAPIVGATKMQHLEDAVAALDIALTDEEMARLEEAYMPHPVLGHH